MSEDKALRRARAKLIKALEENRELDAVELLVELRRFEPENARWPHKQGELLKQLGHHTQAAQVFEKAVGLYAKQGFIARAVAMAKTVVELDPSRISILERIDPQAAQLLRTHKKMSRQARVDLDDRPVEQLPLGTATRGTGPHLRPGPPASPPRQQDLAGLSLPPMAAAPQPVVSQRPARNPEGLSYQKISPDGSLAPAPGRTRAALPLEAAGPPGRAAQMSQAPGRVAPPPVTGSSLAPGRPGRGAPPPPGAAASSEHARAGHGAQPDGSRPGRGAPPPPPGAALSLELGSTSRVAQPEGARSLAPGRGAPPPPPGAAVVLEHGRRGHAAQPEGARSLAPARGAPPGAALSSELGSPSQAALPDGSRSLAPGRGAPPPPPGAAVVLEHASSRAAQPEGSRSLAPARGAPPPPPAAAMQVQAVPAVTLDRLSLPSYVRVPRAAEPSAPVSLDHLYGRALRGVPLLAPDEASPADETRFSDRPPPSSERALAEQLLASSAHKRGLTRRADTETDVAMALASLESDEPMASTLALSEVELAERVPVPVLESHRPEPPTAATLADLPLFPLFAALPQPVLARIVAASELIELSDGAYVLRKDDDGDALYGIASGSVNLTVPGQAFELTLAEGDVFGEACLLEEAKSQLDVLVMGQLTALRIPRAVLLQGIEEHPPLAGLVLALLTRRLLGNLLQVSPLFQDFDAAGKAELARLFEVRRVAAGAQLSVSGKKMDGLYISLSGTLIVEQDGTPAWSAQPGSMFGQNCLLSHTPSSVDVSTAVDMIVLRLPAARFAGLAMQHPTVLERLAELSTSDVVRVML